MIQQNTEPISDEIIRRFLLGNLQSAEQTRFERSLFMDDVLEERVRLAEVELSDDFLAGRLAHAEQALFRDRFLLTADRKRKFAISNALHDRFAASSRLSRTGLFKPAANLFDFRRYALRYAFAAVLLLLLVAGAILVTKDRSHIAWPSFIPKRISPKPSVTATPQFTNHPNSPSTPAHNEPSPALPLHEEPSTRLGLTSNTALESSPLISVSGAGVSFELALDQPLVDVYDVNVTTIAGESVLSASAIKRTEPGTLPVDLPSSAIRSGDFQIVLTRVGGQAKQRADIYYFRVR